MAVRIIDLELIHGPEGARAQFELLCDKLIRSELPQVCHVRVQRGDGGVDSYHSDLIDPKGIHIFQSKFFPAKIGEIQRQQIKKSFERCRSNPEFSLKHWTLCLPIDFSVEEAIWFSNWVRHESASGVLIDCWGASMLENLLYLPKNRGIKEAFFREEHLTQVRETHETIHRIAEDLAGRESRPSKQTIAAQVSSCLQSNLDTAEVLVRSPGKQAVEQSRFDVRPLDALEQQAMSALPELVPAIRNASQLLEQANRLADRVESAFYHWQRTEGRSIVYNKMVQPDYIDPKRPYAEAVAILDEHLRKRVIPQLHEVIESLRTHLAANDPG
jgi:hypothetical protein